ncbi:phage-related baseplate assembly protein J [Escherichia coli]|nr:phage-related baseplate assembly protein J [Escherichia coli]
MPTKITAEMIAKYEADTGKTLYPAQAERLLIDLWAYREMLVRVAVQEAAKQNLVAFSREPMIDYLGELVWCIPPCRAACHHHTSVLCG